MPHHRTFMIETERRDMYLLSCIGRPPLPLYLIAELPPNSFFPANRQAQMLVCLGFHRWGPECRVPASKIPIIGSPVPD